MKYDSKRKKINNEDKDKNKEDKKKISKVYKNPLVLRPVNRKKKEYKMFDYEREVNNILYAFQNNNGYLLNGMFKGAAVYQRIGDFIKIKRIQYKIRINRTDVTDQATNSTFFRLAIVYDSRPNGNLTSSNSVWLTLDKDGTLKNSPYAYQNTGNLDRYTILVEENYISPFPNSPGTYNFYTYVATEPNQTYFCGDIKCDLPVNFFSTGISGEVGDIQAGSISFFPMSPGSNPTHWTAAISVRFTFTDE